MAKDFDIHMDAYLPLRDVVFKTLRLAILKGEIKPGERLMEIQLANKMGVSRTPIREAIRKLELEGLVVMTPRKGAEVAEITEKSLRDTLEVRRALEKLAVRLACERITPAGIEELKEAEQRFEEVFASDDITKLAEVDVAFHDIIYFATDNRKLIHMLSNLQENMYRYRIEYLKNLECHNQLLAEHRALVQAIEAGDKELAAEITTAHIENQVNSVVDKIRGK